jgi:hypothetical protein
MTGEQDKARCSLAGHVAEKLVDSWKNEPTRLLSFPRKRESSYVKGLWIPALHFVPAGMTGAFSAPCYSPRSLNEG